jgi:hypothetical protein|tara:strand:- start:325 stop:825 length:501 start_codon:yes stop_codon:yes gene_type:complete
MGQLNLGNGANFVGGSSGFLADAPKGSILQYIEVAQSVIGPRFSTSSTSYTATNYLVNVTPKKADSMIIIQGSFSASIQPDGYGYFRCYQDGVSSDLYEAGHGSGNTSDWQQTPFKYVFFPGDTSSHQYKIYVRSNSGAKTLYVGWSGSAGSTRNWNHMCAIEIAQ